MTAPASWAEESPKTELRHMAGLFLGLTHESGVETEPTEGLEYMYRAGDHWGVGGLVEYAGGAQRNTVVVAMFYWFPHAGWMFTTGPGLEFHHGEPGDPNVPEDLDESETRYLLKTGAGYEFDITRHFVIETTVNFDIVDDGRQLLIYGVVFGFRF